MLDLSINDEATISFLVNLLNIPSPTGYHQEAIPFVQRAFEAIGLCFVVTFAHGVNHCQGVSERRQSLLDQTGTAIGFCQMHEKTRPGRGGCRLPSGQAVTHLRNALDDVSLGNKRPPPHALGGGGQVSKALGGGERV